MRAHRRWTPGTRASMNDRVGALRSGQEQGAELHWPGARNTRYVSSRTLVDAERSSPRFIPNASIEGWRDSMRRDARMRAALLNPIRHEPPGR